MTAIRDVKIQAALAAREAIRRGCERSLYEFARRFWHVVEPATPFVDGWHIRSICHHLEALTRGSRVSPDRVPFQRFLLNMPPRHMKSLLTCVFWPCWVWSWAPSTRWIFASYAGTFSARDSRKCHAILFSRLWRLLWPDRIVLTKDAETRMENSAGGHRIATSTDGVGTGEGGDFVVVDDPHKARDAYSDVKRKAVLDWWDGSMSSRGNNPETAVWAVIGQRVHDEDLTGHLMKRGDYRALIMPAEYDGEDRSTTGLGADPRTEIGQLLWAERFSKKAIDDLKLSMGSFVASAQLQQRPMPKGGGIVKRGWWRFWREPPAVFEQVIQSWDMTFKGGLGSDYVVGQKWGRIGRQYWLLAQTRGRWGFVDTCEALRSFSFAHPESTLEVLVEEAANGAAVMDALRPHVGGLIPIRPEGSKVARAQAVSPLIEAGNVFIPDPSVASWVDDYLTEWEHFPLGTNDDQVDATTQALRRMSMPSLDPLPRSGGLIRSDSVDPSVYGF